MRFGGLLPAEARQASGGGSRASRLSGHSVCDRDRRDKPGD